MKRPIRFLAVAIIIGLAGFTAVKYARPHKPQFHAHTIVYTIKNYDNKRERYATGTLTRTVEANGVYHQTQALSNGKTIVKDLAMAAPMERGPAGPDERTESMLGYEVIIQNNNSTEYWVAPALGDFLNIVSRRPDNTIDMEMEAISVH
jgi:hypothetical protein